MRFLLSAIAACSSVLVVFACGGDDSGSGPTSTDDGGSPDGTATSDGSANGYVLKKE